jgi:hypothetical protein
MAKINIQSAKANSNEMGFCVLFFRNLFQAHSQKIKFPCHCHSPLGNGKIYIQSAKANSNEIGFCVLFFLESNFKLTNKNQNSPVIAIRLLAMDNFNLSIF